MIYPGAKEGKWALGSAKFVAPASSPAVLTFGAAAEKRRRDGGATKSGADATA